MDRPAVKASMLKKLKVMINNCKVDKKGRIMELGLCSDNCRDEHTEKPLQFTNVNLLTKKECQYFLNTSVS